MATATTKRPKIEAEAAYENAHLIAQDLLTRIGELLFELPAPGSETRPITWSDVSTVIETNRQLSETMAFLASARI